MKYYKKLSKMYVDSKKGVIRRTLLYLKNCNGFTINNNGDVKTVFDRLTLFF